MKCAKMRRIVKAPLERNPKRIVGEDFCHRARFHLCARKSVGGFSKVPCGAVVVSAHEERTPPRCLFPLALRPHLGIFPNLRIFKKVTYIEKGFFGGKKSHSNAPPQSRGLSPRKRTAPTHTHKGEKVLWKKRQNSTLFLRNFAVFLRNFAVYSRRPFLSLFQGKFALCGFGPAVS